MQKNLSKGDYLLALLFIFMLVATVGAFFFGLKTGQDRTEAKYEQILSSMSDQATTEQGAYDQQSLVSFYHTILLPYREFQKKWTEQLTSLEFEDESRQAKDLLREIKVTAHDKYIKINAISMPANSPLLRNAQTNYMKSLKLFEEAAEKMTSYTDQLKGLELVNAINSNSYFNEAKNFGLQAQSEFYQAIVQWNLNMNPRLSNLELTSKDTIGFDQWRQLSLNLKNEYAAKFLKNNQLFELYYPHDLTIRIDEFISSGQPERLQVNDVKAVAEILISAGAIRQDDFLASKHKYYNNQLIPQLPFFYKQ